MKKLLSVVLAAILALSLSVGALAAYEDTDPPQWQQWGYDSLEAYLADWEETEEEYYAEIAYDVALEREYPAWREAYLAAHPDYAAQLLADDEPPLWEFWDCASREEFESDVLNGEQSYEDWLVDWYLTDLFWDEWNASQLLREREAMGGPAEGVGVMWMGEYVRFPDAQPTLSGGRTMIPVRALAELAGLSADYADGVVTLAREDGVSLRFRAGEKTAAVQKDGETSTVALDAAPYLDAAAGRIYVPVRFFSEALGYDVLWDENYQTAVILDPAAMIAALDAEFGVVNRFLAAQAADPETAYRSSGTLNGSLTVFDTLNGNKTGKLKAELSGLSMGMNADLRASWDVSGLLSLLDSLTDLYLDEEEMAALKAAAGSDLELILNAEAGRLYLKSPLLATLSEGELPKDAWVSASFDPDMPGALYDRFGGQSGTASVGALLYYANLNDWYGVGACDAMRSGAETLAQVIGDGCFTRSGGGWTAALDLSSLEELSGYGLSYEYDLTDFKLTLNVRDDGTCTGSLALTESDYSGADAVRLTASFEFGKLRSSATLKLHEKNRFELELQTSATASETSQTLRTEPPAGATVIDADELAAEPYVEMDLGLIGSADGPLEWIGQE